MGVRRLGLEVTSSSPSLSPGLGTLIPSSEN